MFDAQSELYKIIHLIEDRFRGLFELKNELNKSNPDANKLKKIYSDSLRLSTRIATECRVLKSIEPCLDRPFMFNGD